ncbi:iron-containing redox enzyme family protein [Sulfuriflexus sp.]|uniref:TenA family transcriptional regulator n=1 Tax=Sulfuriflexus sp. TaxID=2015443 RepID=UPI0028CD5352|nr:iron-containing redox enzyme family protein [Sulfuriflexus sp.]MDT8403417.1 iron-containing redox enzyme family protein [Sulfuriflexus sp.]
MKTFFEILTAATEAERMQLYSVPQITDARHGNITRDSYLAYLEQAYHHVKHTVPLMMAAGSRLPESKEYLREALVEYAEEEVGHQEWILNDIKHAGGNAEQVRRGEPNAATELMIAYAYDYVSRINPVGFFGMVFVLEGTSIQLATSVADSLQTALGLPENCFSYLASHGSLDLEHMKFFENLVNQIDDPDDQQAIIHVARRIFILFARVFESIPHKETLKHVV